MNLGRRRFIRKLSLSGGALTLGVSLSGCDADLPPLGEEGDYIIDAFLRIGEDDTAVMQLPKAEMGQGVLTGLATIVAEELAVEPAALRVEMAPVHPAYNDPEYRIQITGGSTSVRHYYDTLRTAGAGARAVLLEAAARQSGLPVAQLRAESGEVRDSSGRFRARYGELVATARTLPLPGEIALKSPQEFRLIGRFDQRLDAAAKSDGSARFGIDASPPGCLTAVVLRSPVFGGTLVDFDATAAMELDGLVDIFPIEQGVAVVAEGYWQARRAADRVETNFLDPAHPLRSSTDVDAAMTAAFEDGDFASVRSESGSRDESPDGGRWVEADYRLPFLAHATMEPQNATAWFRDGRCDLWIGSQSPDMAAAAVSRVLDIPVASVTVHNQFLGGGFGRRAMPDSALEVAAIAARVDRPVKLVMSREDDTRHDYYRPAMAGRLRARVDETGEVAHWQHRLVGPSIYEQMVPSSASLLMPEWMPGAVLRFIGERVGRKDSAAIEGAADLPYRFDGVEVAYHALPTPVPLGFWRSVGHSHTAFVVESFIDELADAAGQDPLAFRRRYLPPESPERRVMDVVAEAANWGNAPQGRFQGLAVHLSFHTAVAEVVEISLEGDRPKLEKVYCAVDCGTVINPDIARDQIESGVVFALSAALYGEITLDGGAVSQGNFHDYPVLRHHEMPEVEVLLLDSDAPPTGVGEPGTPPAAPALANAIFAATGRRLRRLPLALGA